MTHFKHRFFFFKVCLTESQSGSIHTALIVFQFIVHTSFKVMSYHFIFSVIYNFADDVPESLDVVPETEISVREDVEG